MKPKTNRAGDPQTSHPFDQCQTPPYAVAPLVPYLRPDWRIWEPAAGEGLLVAALLDAGIAEVISTDLLTGQDFFIGCPESWDALVTNPPYSVKYRWLARCYALGKPFALLMPVETLGAKTAQVLFAAHGVEIIFLDKRVDFKMPNKGWGGSAAQFPVAWYTHGLDIGHPMTFATLHKPNAQRRAELAAGVAQLVMPFGVAP